jgi:hypothetical protein
MTATPAQIERTAKDWNRIAGETVEVEQVGSAMYAYGSELATLRLLKAFRETSAARQNYSANLETWYFCIELIN